jgi:hypothetical protein
MLHLPKYLLPSIGNNTLLTNIVELYHRNNITDLYAGVSSDNDRQLRSLTGVRRIIVSTETMAETVHKITQYVDCLDDYNEHKNILLMPDTHLGIGDELQTLINKLDYCDLVLMLWKIKDYQIGKVGQCRIVNNRVVDVIDKDKNCTYEYFWGALGWNNNVSNLIDPKWSTIGDLIRKAIESNLKIDYVMCQGDYYDCGTPEEYFRMIKERLA